MAHRIRPFRNVHTILATAAGLILLVSLALGWLGWRLLEQEEALQQQQARDALEGKANIIQTRFLSRMAEIEAALRGLDGKAAESANESFGDGAVLVTLNTGVHTRPAGQIAYLPAAPPFSPLNESIFEEARKLEFQGRDLEAASVALSAIAANQPSSRPEALLRLAGVQKKNGRPAEALATYAKLLGEKNISPILEAPYGVLARIQRAELLKATGEADNAKREAEELISLLDAGEWGIEKGTYEYYYARARDLAGRHGEKSTEVAKLATSEMVVALWDEWRQFRRSASQSLSKSFHFSDPIPVLAIVNANPDRMVAVIYTGDALRHWLPDPAAANDTSGIHVELIGPQERTLFGEETPAHSYRVMRSLSPASLSWQLAVSASASSNSTFASERRNYLILVLIVIVLLVGLACYAMARGVLREAAAGQLQSDFVSAVSHEFRSPLTTLRQLTELLADGRIIEEGRRRQYFMVMQKETSRLHQLVENLLDFGRMDAGRRQYHLEPLDLADLVRESVAQYRNEAGASGHSIEMAPCSGPLTIEADREALQRVVRNLLENAVKYSPEARTVWVETGREGLSAVLRVRDQGMGIPPDEKKHIFEKFVRGDAAKRAAIPGTGIGLAMVQEIIRVHHGHIDVDSEVGAGSTFSVRLPLVPDVSSAVVRETETVQGSAR